MSAFLSDGIVSLRPVRSFDLDQLAAWRNDPEVRTRTREWAPLTEADQKHWFDEVVCAPTDERRDFMFVVEADATATSTGEMEVITLKQPIGCVGLCHWNPRDRVSEISFYIGNQRARGNGYCKRALRQLIDWGFRELDLALIYAEVFSFNEPGFKILEGLGFEKEGVLRSRVHRMGERWDVIPMSLLRPDISNMSKSDSEVMEKCLRWFADNPGASEDAMETELLKLNEPTRIVLLKLAKEAQERMKLKSRNSE